MTEGNYGTRVAKLEAFSANQREALAEIKAGQKELQRALEDVRRDLHGAKFAGRAILACAMFLGGIIGWAFK